MSIVSGIKASRQRRKWRVRNSVKISGSNRSRLTVYRSNKHIYVQVIDDVVGNTIVSASTVEHSLRSVIANGGNVEAAKSIGKLTGERCLSKGIMKVVFDRGCYKYHGRVAAIAQGAREAGLDF